MKEKLKKIPIAYGGLALGIAGITTAWSILSPSFKIVKYVGAVIAIVFLFILLLKICIQPDSFKREVKQSMLGSMFQTFFMALSVVSAALIEFNYSLFKALWLLSAFGMTFYLLYFIHLRFKQKDFHTLLPSCFVPTIGVAIIAVTCSAMNSYSMPRVYLNIAFVLLTILYPMMIYKFFFVEKIDDKMTPVFAIFGAPPNITLVGYLTSSPDPNKIIVYMLIAVGVFSTFLVYITIHRIKRIDLNFTPLFASLTFPLAIGTTATLKFHTYLVKQAVSNEYLYIWKTLACIEIIIASIIIFYVFVNMIIFSYKNIFKSKNIGA